MRSISIFGATGSIGQNTVDLIKRDTENHNVFAISGARNISLLAQQAVELGAEIAITSEKANLSDLQTALAGTGVAAAAGRTALIEAARRPVDWAMSAIVGFAGLEVSLAVAENNGVLALANKESLVCAGELLNETCAGSGCRLLPVDSEHSAIFQAMSGEDQRSVERIILTASGGPFLRSSLEEMRKATPEQAVAHPNWDMGQRISIDSASMFNKAMEMIETKDLFQTDPNLIEVIVHPQSIVHSMVGFNDGAIMAHVGPADMRGPIGFALNYPNRSALPLERLDFGALGRLDFEHPDETRFPAIRLARDVMRRGGYSGAVFNAAKEQALDLFLDRKIGFLDMADLVEKALDAQMPEDNPGKMTLEQVVKVDSWARDTVKQAATKL